MEGPRREERGVKGEVLSLVNASLFQLQSLGGDQMSVGW